MLFSTEHPSSQGNKLRVCSVISPLPHGHLLPCHTTPKCCGGKKKPGLLLHGAESGMKECSSRANEASSWGFGSMRAILAQANPAGSGDVVLQAGESKPARCDAGHMAPLCTVGVP